MDNMNCMFLNLYCILLLITSINNSLSYQPKNYATLVNKRFISSRSTLSTYRLYSAHDQALILYSSATDASSANSKGSQDFDTKTKSPFHSINLLYMRFSWLTWWAQVILSVISGVILTFANTVRLSGFSKSLWTSGFSFSTIGVILSFVSTFWTWNVTRLNRRIQLNKIQKANIIPTLRKYSEISIALSLVGMLVTLIGAEQIVGTLASKVLMSQSYINVVTAPGLSPSSSLQPLDIFLVQANTNALVAHFFPLLCYSCLQKYLPHDVPPNTTTSGTSPPPSKN